jgi:uncharacterized protein YbaA (DUF1428 family)
MAKYVDGFVIAVPKNKLDDYKKMARVACKVWMELGAVDYQECVADDAPYGKVTSFPRAVQRKNNETVVFSWITYKSRAQRDKINEQVMKDPRILKIMEESGDIMDPSRMIYGGFKGLVSA